VYSTRNLSVSRTARFAETTVCCDVAGFGVLRVSPEKIPVLRKQPGPPHGEPLSASLLKHLDEQTLVGLGAVLHAIKDHGLAETVFTDWGILAAPRFLGRVSLAVALHRFQLEGAWGISPHLIPHHSLHALSGTISQALKVHGPNFGVGGGPHAADEGFLTTAALLAGDRVPGVWLILTGHEPELVPENPAAPAANGNGKPAVLPSCAAVALALVATRPGSQRLKLHISPGPLPGQEQGLVEQDQGKPFFYLEALLDTLLSATPRGAWQLHCGGGVELKRHGAGAEN
jgi:hypothetical protein